jgi:hypothetical protein
VRRILGWGTARGHRAVCAAATQLRGRVDLGWEILPPRPRNGVATHGHDGGAAASEGGDNVALQAQRKRLRTSSIREVELVRNYLLACAFPGVQDNTPVPKLKGLLFQHWLATRLVCPDRGFGRRTASPSVGGCPGLDGVVWARPHDHHQLCRVGSSCAQTVVGGCLGLVVGVSCVRLAVPGGLVTHRVRAPPGQPERPGPCGNSLRPGREHVVRQKPC